VIGNTGAGKSTLVNYMCGAEMEEVIEMMRIKEEIRHAPYIFIHH
jgi:GTPase Era involved in 16S rRNA processing